MTESSNTGKVKNPYFYVSSSEWNLYDYLNTTFKKHGLPEGIFLLNEIKSLKDLLKTGKTGHQGKYDRIKALLEAFPDQNYVLIGDNSQRDPVIYRDITIDFPGRIIGVFIRNKVKKNQSSTQSVMKEMNVKNNQTILFNHTKEAISTSRKWGLIL